MKAWERARKHIVDLLARPEMKHEGTRLPTTAQMAREAGVCTATMWRAVGSLAEENLLDVRPGAGIRVGRKVHCPARLRPPHTRKLSGPRARVLGALQKDVLSGRFRPGAFLPPVKFLASEHGVCSTTMRRALDTLVREGMLSIVSRRYAMRPAHVRHHGTVLCLLWQDSDTFRTLESEASRAGVRLMTAPLFPADAFRKTLNGIHGNRSSGPLLGVVTAILGGLPTQYRDIARIVKPTGRPLAIIDRTGGARLAHLRSNRLTRIIAPPTEWSMGSEVARYLLGLGHRRIVYLSPMHDLTWSLERLAGIVDIYSHAGSDCSVEAVTQHCNGPSKETNDEFLANIGSLRELVLSSTVPNRRTLACAIARMDRKITAEAQWVVTESTLRRLMEQALHTPGVTAWVACNDRVASAALAFLQRRGRKIPHDLSIIGYDNSLLAMREHLTSYGHDTPALVLAALTHILGYGTASPRPTSEPRITVDGTLAVRSTTAPVRRGGGPPTEAGRIPDDSVARS